MKKVLAMSSVLLGVVFLAGCGQQPVSQTRPTTPAPVAQTPTQPVATQPAQQPVASNPAENKIVYTNNEYKFKIALPEAYKDYKALEEKTDKNTSVQFGIKSWRIDIRTTAKEFAPEYYEPSFSIAVQKADIWDKTPDCAGLLPTAICFNKEYLLGKKDGIVFYVIPSQERSDVGQKILEDFVFSQKIKQNFQLF